MAALAQHGFPAAGLEASVDAGRVGWLDVPTCGNCHTGTATDNSGQIRFTSVFDSPGHRRIPANSLFDSNPDTPLPGFSLYRMSFGHGGLQCSACHGSTHAIFPSSHASDNVASVDAQGHVGVLSDCTACHGTSPSTETGGPHGMHPVGQPCMKGHEGAVEGDDEGPGSSSCKACHGADLKGTELSRALGDRTLTSEFGTKSLWRGATVSCWLCHNGPSSESKTKEAPPVVSGAVSDVDAVMPTPIALQASDPDGDSLQLRVVTQPLHGTVGLVGKTATYYPEPGYVGPASFTFAAWDGLIESNLGLVTLLVADPGCPATLSSDSVDVGAAGGQASVMLDLPVECAWTVTKLDPLADWVQVTSVTAGDGPTVITLNMLGNTGAAARSTVLVLGGRVFTVHQSGTSGPDLTGQWEKVLEVCKSKKGVTKCRLRARLLVTNVGDATASKSRVRFCLSDDTKLDAGDTLLKEGKVKKLKPGKHTRRKLKVKLPPGTTASSRHILAVLDADGVIAEITESDRVVASDQLP